MAVSRQVKLLEEWLGATLFTRGTRAIHLTPEGARLLEAVRQALDALALATGQMSRRGRRDVLAIQAYTTFARRWLIPLLGRFHDEHPDIEVRLTTSVIPVDFAYQDLDAAVRSGNGRSWPGLEADFLTPYRIAASGQPGPAGAGTELSAAYAAALAGPAGGLAAVAGQGRCHRAGGRPAWAEIRKLHPGLRGCPAGQRRGYGH